MKTLAQSKTVYFNVIVFIVAFLAMPEFINVMPSSWLPFIVLGGALGNLILRIFFTSKEII